ncbi:MAG: hypothetical protein ACLT9P_01235 [Evtepia gabavorous]
MAELYRFELKKCLQQKVLWITGGILLVVPVRSWGRQPCLRDCTDKAGCGAREIIRLHREGGAALDRRDRGPGYAGPISAGL